MYKLHFLCFPPCLSPGVLGCRRGASPPAWRAAASTFWGTRAAKQQAGRRTGFFCWCNLRGLQTGTTAIKTSPNPQLPQYMVRINPITKSVSQKWERDDFSVPAESFLTSAVGICFTAREWRDILNICLINMVHEGDCVLLLFYYQFF